VGGRAVYFRLSPLVCASFMRSFSPSATKAAIAAVAPLVLHQQQRHGRLCYCRWTKQHTDEEMQSSSLFAPASQVSGRFVDGCWSEGEGEEKVVEQQQQVRKLELEAYAAVLRAFGAQSEVLTWAKERLMSDLRKELRVTEEQHWMILGEVDDVLREYWPGGGASSRMLLAAAAGVSTAAVMDGNANTLQSRKKQKTTEPVGSPFVESAAIAAASTGGGWTQGGVSTKRGGGGVGAPRAKKAAALKPVVASQPGVLGFDIPVDNWLGRRVKTRWPDDTCFYEAVITRYDRERGLHALVYDMDTLDETWEWVNLKDMNKNDLLWVDAPRVSLAGKRVPPEEGAGMGRDSVTTTTQGIKWQETTVGSSGVLSALMLGKQKNSQRGQQAISISSPQQQQVARPWGGSGSSATHLDIVGLASRKGSSSVEVPDFAPLFMKDTDAAALEQEESMDKLEHIRKMASEHEVMLHRALADVGESEDDSDN